MKQMEYWRWRYTHPQTGRPCRTMFQFTAEEAQKLPNAERIPGTMLLRDIGESFGDTVPAMMHRNR